MLKKKLGRPRQGKEVKVQKSVRVELSKFEAILRKYGGLQKFFDKVIRKEFKS